MPSRRVTPLSPPSERFRLLSIHPTGPGSGSCVFRITCRRSSFAPLFFQQPSKGGGDGRNSRAIHCANSIWEYIPKNFESAWRIDTTRTRRTARGETGVKNFRLIAKELAVEPLLEEIDRLPGVWDLQIGRQNVTVQREARAISIRGLKKSKIRGRQRRDVHESRYTTISRQFPATTRFICSWANALD